MIANALRLDPVTGDLALVNGSLAQNAGADAVMQALMSRLRFARGEWFLDLEVGVPYWEDIIAQKGEAALIPVRETFRREILASPGITAVTSIATSWDNATRRMTLTFSATSEAGPVSVTEFEVFA